MAYEREWRKPPDSTVDAKEGDEIIRKMKEEQIKDKEKRGDKGAKVKVTHMDPKLLEIPDVRVTSQFADDLIDMFKEDIKKDGINTPLLIAHTDGKYLVIDGMHRLQEALLNGFKTVPCIVKEMTEADSLLRNLVTNRLRGKTPASEEAKVVRHLYDKLGISIEDICKRTGMRKERLEMLINIGSASTSVIEALDEGKITVCHAYELARLPETGMQIKLLHQLFITKMTCADIRDVINEIIKFTSAKVKQEQNREVLLPPPIPTAKCGLCEEMYPPKDCVSPIICKYCWGRMIATVDDLRRDAETAKQVPVAKAKEILDSTSKGAEGSNTP
jgi:ParB family chromosome partitioning protein